MTGFVVIVAGGFGAGLRFVVSDWMTRRALTELPWGTAAVNGCGAMLLGFVVGVGLDGLVLTGVAGGLSGFTTYSTWMVETVALWDEGHSGRIRALVNWIGLFAIGLMLAALGWAIGGAIT